MQIRPTIQIDNTRLEQFCQQWQIQTLDLFGSVLRDDFSPESDIDLLVAFDPDAHWTLLDWVDMEDELAEIFGYPVDLVSRQAIEESYNQRRRERILKSAKPVIMSQGGVHYAMA